MKGESSHAVYYARLAEEFASGWGIRDEQSRRTNAMKKCIELFRTLQLMLLACLGTALAGCALPQPSLLGVGQCDVGGQRACYLFIYQYLFDGFERREPDSTDSCSC
jgi:hypothetical protein